MFAFMKCFDKKKQTEQEPLLEEGAAKKPTKKQSYKPPEDPNEDPYNALGFGMVAYRDLMLTLIYLYSVCTILMAPAFYYYTSGSGYGGSFGSYDAYSMGNFGYSQMQCTKVPVDLNKITMSCTYGVISDVYYIGVNPSDMVDKDTTTFLQTVKSNITSDPTVTSYLYTYTSEELWNSSVTTPSTCTGFKATMYIQYPCTQTDDTLSLKHRQAAYISACSVFLVFLYIIVIYYFKRVSKLIQLDWDVSTITPGDYTVQYEITDTAYDTFMREIYPESKARGISTGEALKNAEKGKRIEALAQELRSLKLRLLISFSPSITLSLLISSEKEVATSCIKDTTR
jgi:hypothetical protein